MLLCSGDCEVNLIAVSKMVAAEKIAAAIKADIKIFGENYVNEAKAKWLSLKEKYPQIKLHLIGHLQSNKAEEALKLFDVIQTLDSEKLAKILAIEMKKLNKFPEIFVQINIGEEAQKHGIAPTNANQFIKFARDDCNLPIIGVMGIAPLHSNPAPYFSLLKQIAHNNNLPNISMGMSDDFATAIALGANHIRIGSAIFGKRK